MMPPARVTVVIPTFRRPEGLERAVRSLFSQTVFSRETIKLIIVDNDPSGSTLAIARDVLREAPQAIDATLLHEPRPGVANARNAAMVAVSTPLVAFLDDDQTAQDSWLDELLAVYERAPCAVTFGPYHTSLPASTTKHFAYFNDFFAREPGHADGPISDFYGCGNALLDLARLPHLDPMFDPRTNRTGGEDDLLFNATRAAGGGFAWAGRAGVFEHVPENRARLGYTLRRALAYGQGPCTLARYEKRYDKLARWVVIGAAQTLVYGAAALGAFALRLPGRAFLYDRTARGFGKVIWWKTFHFYGAPPTPVSENRAAPDIEARA